MSIDGRPLNGAWKPPDYEVDDDGKIIGRSNARIPNNWGRWGDLDERGTANFLTPDLVVEAAKLVRIGETVSCAIPIDRKGPVHPTRLPPLHLYHQSGTDMVAGSEMARRNPGYQGTDDYLVMSIQGSTQWDGLAHIAYDDSLYNGFWLGNVESYYGAKRCSIHQLASSLVGRGVLLDLLSSEGVARLEPGHAIDAAALDRCAAAMGVEVRRGDIVLIRTGHLPWFYELRDKREFWRNGAPGLAPDTASWCHEREIAALAMDNIGIEVEPFPHDSPPYPLHQQLITDLGLTLGEMWWLEDLAEACAREGRYEFFLSAPPLKLMNASGSMLNPVAVL